MKTNWRLWRNRIKDSAPWVFLGATGLGLGIWLSTTNAGEEICAMGSLASRILCGGNPSVNFLLLGIGLAFASGVMLVWSLLASSKHYIPLTWKDWVGNAINSLITTCISLLLLPVNSAVQVACVLIILLIGISSGAVISNAAVGLMETRGKGPWLARLQGRLMHRTQQDEAVDTTAEPSPEAPPAQDTPEVPVRAVAPVQDVSAVTAGPAAEEPQVQEAPQAPAQALPPVRGVTAVPDRPAQVGYAPRVLLAAAGIGAAVAVVTVLSVQSLSSRRTSK